MSIKIVDFFYWRILAFLFSISLTIAAAIGYFEIGLNLGIDFTGGIITEIKLSNPALGNGVKESLEKKYKNISIQISNTDVLLRFQNSEHISDNIEIDNVKADILKVDNKAQILKLDVVGPKISSDLMNKSIWAFFWALLMVMIYVFIRFDWKFSIAAILSLCHDVFASIGFFIFTGYEFNLTSIAAILTIIGYSVNDSVVIFDRIRENQKKLSSKITPKLINKSINETLSRTMMTFLTTFVACIALWIFGGDSLRSFSAAITFGIAFGTYSSIFISANVLPYMNDRHQKNKSF